jgi:hypothetical protein
MTVHFQSKSGHIRLKHPIEGLSFWNPNSKWRIYSRVITTTINVGTISDRIVTGYEFMRVATIKRDHNHIRYHDSKPLDLLGFSPRNIVIYDQSLARIPDP